MHHAYTQKIDSVLFWFVLITGFTIHEILDKNVAIPVFLNKIQEYQICVNALLFICWTLKINWVPRNWILWGVAIYNLKKKFIFLVSFYLVIIIICRLVMKIKMYLKCKKKSLFLYVPATVCCKNLKIKKQ